MVKAKRRYRWSYEKYRDVLMGNDAEGIPGLRSIASGFAAGDGFSLREFDSWSPAKRRKVRETFGNVTRLLGQAKRIVRARGENLRILQKTFHGATPSRNLKVAYVPDIKPAVTEAQARKAPKLRIRVKKDAVSIGGRNFERVEVTFNKRRLATNAQTEIARAAQAMPGAAFYHVQVGEFQSLNGKSLRTVTEQILEWMEKYDGVTPLPSNSGNAGDNPRLHRWQLWLDGLVGYVIPPGVDKIALSREIIRGRRDAQRDAEKRNNYFRRKGGKKRK